MRAKIHREQERVSGAKPRERLASLGDSVCCVAITVSGMAGFLVVAWLASRVTWPA